MTLKKKNTMKSRSGTTLSSHSSLGLSSSGDDSSLSMCKSVSSKRRRSSKTNTYSNNDHKLSNREMEEEKQQRANSNNVKLHLNDLLTEITSFSNMYNEKEPCRKEQLRRPEKNTKRWKIENNALKRRVETCSANCSTSSTQTKRNSKNSVNFESLKFVEILKSIPQESEMSERWIAYDDYHDGNNNNSNSNRGVCQGVCSMDNYSCAKVSVHIGRSNTIVRNSGNNKFSNCEKTKMEIADRNLEEVKKYRVEQEDHDLYSNYGLEAAKEFLSTPQSQHILQQQQKECNVDKNIYDPLLSCTSSDGSKPVSLFSTEQVFSPPPTVPRIKCKDKKNVVNLSAQFACNMKEKEFKQCCEVANVENDLVFHCANAKSIVINDEANTKVANSYPKYSLCSEEQGSTRCNKKLRIDELTSPFARSTSFTPDETVRSLLAANPFTEPRPIALAEGVEMPSPQTPLWSQLDATDAIEEQEEELHQMQHVSSDNVLIRETAYRGEREPCQSNERHDARLSMLYNSSESFGNLNSCIIEQENDQNDIGNDNNSKVCKKNCTISGNDESTLSVYYKNVLHEEKIELIANWQDMHESECVTSVCLPSSHMNNSANLETIFNERSNRINNYKNCDNSGRDVTLTGSDDAEEHLQEAGNNTSTINSDNNNNNNNNNNNKSNNEISNAQDDNLFSKVCIGMQSTADCNYNIDNTNLLQNSKWNNSEKHPIYELITRETVGKEKYESKEEEEEEEEEEEKLSNVIDRIIRDKSPKQNYFSLTQEASEQEMSKPFSFHLPRRSYNANTTLEHKPENAEQMANSSLVKRDESYLYLPSHQLDYSEDDTISNIRRNTRFSLNLKSETEEVDNIQIEESQPLRKVTINEFEQAKSNPTTASINSTILIKEAKLNNEYWAEEMRKFFTYLDSRPLIVVARTPEKFLDYPAAESNRNEMKIPRRSEFEKLIANVKGKGKNTQSHSRLYNVDNQGAA